jgi:hypothetical protein
METHREELNSVIPFEQGFIGQTAKALQTPLSLRNVKAAKGKMDRNWDAEFDANSLPCTTRRCRVVRWESVASTSAKYVGEPVPRSVLALRILQSRHRFTADRARRVAGY